jgi:hypothetical protein
VTPWNFRNSQKLALSSSYALKAGWKNFWLVHKFALEAFNKLEDTLILLQLEKGMIQNVCLKLCQTQ